MANISELKLWFEQQHINVSFEWLQACVQWLIEDNHNQPISFSQLKTNVYEQWLASDLQQLGSSCLPSSVLTAGKTILNGIFPLQVNAFKDISQPAYSQLVKLRKIDHDNSTVSATPAAPVPYWEAKSKRMLMLSLTDGTHCLQGMEYRPIAFLSTELPPGTKIMVIGPVECRLGILMLTGEKVKLLGGDVEHLLKENDQHHILARTLCQDGDSDSQQDNRNESQLSHNQDTQSIDGFSANQEMGRITYGSVQSKPSCFSHVSTRSEDEQGVQNYDFEELEDDDFLTQLDYEQLDRIEQENNTTIEIHDRRTSHAVISTDGITKHEQESNEAIMEDVDEDMLREQLEFQHALEAQEMQNVQSIAQPSKSLKEQDTNADLLPFEYLNHTLQTLNPRRQSVITIKGFITTITSRLECNEEQGWYLTAKINDGSASLEVDLHDKVLYKFIGIKAEEVMLIKNMAHKDEGVKLKIMQAMQQCKQKLQDLNCLMVVEFSPTKPRPCVIKCNPLEKQHIKQLLQRIKNRF